jgi:hypothetical protein
VLLIPQALPRCSFSEGRSGTAGVNFQKTFPIRLSKFPREAFLTEIPTICQENNRKMTTEEGKHCLSVNPYRRRRRKRRFQFGFGTNIRLKQKAAKRKA